MENAINVMKNTTDREISLGQKLGKYLFQGKSIEDIKLIFSKHGPTENKEWLGSLKDLVLETITKDELIDDFDEYEKILNKFMEMFDLILLLLPRGLYLVRVFISVMIDIIIEKYYIQTEDGLVKILFPDEEEQVEDDSSEEKKYLEENKSEYESSNILLKETDLSDLELNKESKEMQENMPKLKNLPSFFKHLFMVSSRLLMKNSMKLMMDRSDDKTVKLVRCEIDETTISNCDCDTEELAVMNLLYEKLVTKGYVEFIETENSNDNIKSLLSSMFGGLSMNSINESISDDETPELISDEKPEKNINETGVVVIGINYGLIDKLTPEEYVAATTKYSS